MACFLEMNPEFRWNRWPVEAQFLMNNIAGEGPAGGLLVALIPAFVEEWVPVHATVYALALLFGGLGDDNFTSARM